MSKHGRCCAGWGTLRVHGATSPDGLGRSRGRLSAAAQWTPQGQPQSSPRRLCFASRLPRPASTCCTHALAALCLRCLRQQERLHYEHQHYLKARHASLRLPRICAPQHRGEGKVSWVTAPCASVGYISGLQELYARRRHYRPSAGDARQTAPLACISMGNKISGSIRYRSETCPACGGVLHQNSLEEVPQSLASAAV